MSNEYEQWAERRDRTLERVRQIIASLPEEDQRAIHANFDVAERESADILTFREQDRLSLA